MTDPRPPEPIPESERTGRVRWTVGLVALTTVAALVYDLNHPLGVAAGITYLVPILVSLRAQSVQVTLGTAVVGSFLTVLGFGLSSQASPMPIVLTNRALTLLALVSVAGVGVLWIRAMSEIRARLTASEGRYGALLEAAGDGILLVDPAGRIEFCSVRAAAIFGYESAALLGRSVHELVPRLEESSSRRGEPEAAVSSEVWSVETDGIRADATPVPLEISVSPYRDGSGERMATWVVRDVTELLEGRREREQSRRLQTMGRLAGGVAHDFNNLLTVITTTIDLMRGGKLADDPSVADDLEAVSRAADRATRLTSQLLAFGRRQVLTPKAHDPNELLNEIVLLLRRLLPDNVEIDFRPGRRVPRIFFDQAQFEQVIVNLAVNSRDAIGSRPGRITIRTAPGHVDESLAVRVAAGPKVVVTVTDDGDGMAPDMLDRIFDPFFTTKEVGRGTGLGLATVHGILEQSHSQVTVQSEVGSGTTFRIYIPVAVGGEIQGGETVREAGASAGRSVRVLLVEDDPEVCKACRRMLDRMGYEVAIAELPSRALSKMAAEGPFDLLVTDVIMPEMDGIELADRIRKAQPGIRVLLMSGYTEAMIERDVSGLPFVQKPFTTTAFADAVRGALET